MVRASIRKRKLNQILEKFLVNKFVFYSPWKFSSQQERAPWNIDRSRQLRFKPWWITSQRQSHQLSRLSPASRICCGSWWCTHITVIAFNKRFSVSTLTRSFSFGDVSSMTRQSNLLSTTSNNFALSLSQKVEFNYKFLGLRMRASGKLEQR